MGTIVNAPNEVLSLILSDEDTPLESLVALDQTCTLLHSVLLSQDDTIVKQKVLDRLPWMEIGQPGTQIETWMDAARLIVARRRSFDLDLHEWVDADQYYDSYDNIARNTDITYIDSIEIDGKMKPQGENLPLSFSPMFDAEIPTPCGELIGKYMEELDGDETRFIDLTTLEYSKKHPEPPPQAKRWSGELDAGLRLATGEFATRLPLSDILVVNKNGDKFKLLQETEMWVLVESVSDYDDPDTGEIRPLYEKLVLCKEDVTLEEGENRLYFDETDMADTRIFNDSQYKFVHFLPGSTGVIVFDSSGDVMLVYYQDVYCHKPIVLLTHLNFEGSDFTERFRLTEGMRDKGTTRQLVVTYGGQLYLHILESVLIPLWADFGELDPEAPSLLDIVDAPRQGISGGLRVDMKTLLLSPAQDQLSRQQTYGIILSQDGRWAMQTLSCGRRVVDLATQKTYIIRELAKWPNPGFVFVGLDASKQLPVFYRCHMAYGIKQDDDGWEDLDEVPASASNIKDTGSYLKFRDPNEIRIGDQRRMIPHRSTVVQPNIRDQAETSVQLVVS